MGIWGVRRHDNSRNAVGDLGEGGSVQKSTYVLLNVMSLLRLLCVCSFQARKRVVCQPSSRTSGFRLNEHDIANKISSEPVERPPGKPLRRHLQINYIRSWFQKVMKFIKYINSINK